MANREEKFKTHRIFLIEHSIRNGEYPSIQKMAEYHGVSIRTIKRDIEFLRDRYNAPVEYDKNRNGYYYTDPTFMIQNVLLTEGDLFTVSTIMPLMEQYKNTPLENSFKNIMEKISEMLPNQVNVNTSFLNSDVSFISDPLPKIDNMVFERIFESIKLKRTIEFEYRSIAKTQYTNKKIDCYKVICQKGNWYVLGLSHNKNEVRIYALSRMQNVKLIEETFDIPRDFNLNN
jgi:proteasome accessory factor B